MSWLGNYIKESVDELNNKVTWPTWPELQSSSIIVLIATVIISLIIWVMDFAASNVLQRIYDTIG